jgi:tetratricopeptide (TPR) repeat protein
MRLSYFFGTMLVCGLLMLPTPANACWFGCGCWYGGGWYGGWYGGYGWYPYYGYGWYSYPYAYGYAYPYSYGGWVVAQGESSKPRQELMTKAAPQPQAFAQVSPQPIQGARATLPVTKPAAKPADEWIDDYPKDAQECFRLGCVHYKDCYYPLARAYFNQAVRLNEQDARYWYFKAFTELAMDNRPLAVSSIQRAQDLRARGLPAAQQIDLAFAQLPLSARQFLAEVGQSKAEVNVIAARR